MIQIKNKRKIITKIISEVPKPSNIEYVEYIFRGNKMRWVDSNMKMKLLEIMHQCDDFLNETIGYVDFDMTINNSRSDENILCNLVVDIIKYIGNADISIINAGNIRNNLFMGNITYKNIINILPFYNEIIIKEIKGSDILDALEFGTKLLPNKTPRFPQISGIIFVVNANIKSNAEVDDNEIFAGIKGERTVKDVIINEEKLNLEKKYKVILFIL